jgi:hypothetical protein
MLAVSRNVVLILFSVLVVHCEGSETVNNSGSGGHNNGGASATGGAASSTGGTISTENAVAVGCGLLCAHADDCPNDSEANCLVRCGALGSNEDCASEYTSYADCLQTAEFGCNTDGLVSVVGCEGPGAAAAACILGIEPNEELVEPCEEYCTQVVAAGCENTEGQASCVNGCTLFGATDFPCASDWKQVLTCSEGATFECDSNGNAVPVGCELDIVSFGLCVLPSG